MVRCVGLGGKAPAVALALLAGTSFGFGGAISQIAAAAGFSVMQVCFGQFVSAVIILGALVALRFRPAMSLKKTVQLIALGAVSSVSTLTYYLAIDMLSVSAAVAIQFQYVWITVLFQAVFERELPGKWTVLSAVLIVVGTFFGSGMADEALSGGLTMNPLGLLFAIVCAVFYAIFIYMNGRVATEYHPVPRTFFEAIGGAILVSALMPLNGGFAFDFVALVPWSIVMGVIMSVIPVLSIVAASDRLPGGLVAILTSTELPMAVLAGALILGETVTPLIVGGVCVILAAIALAQLDGRSKHDTGSEFEGAEQSANA